MNEMKSFGTVKDWKMKGTGTVTSLDEIKELAKEDIQLQEVLDHMKKREVPNILKEIKEILYVDNDEIYISAIMALPYLYYNYVIFMDYYRNTIEYFDDFEVEDVEGESKEDLYITVKLSDGATRKCTLKEFCDIVEPSCKYFTNVNCSADLYMPSSITDETVFDAIKTHLFN